MTTLFERAADMLNRRMKETQGVSVTYSRASTGDSVAITAWVGRSQDAADAEGQGLRVEYGDRDYLIEAADLVLGGAATEPAGADRITETVNGVATVFEVMPLNTGAAGWRWSDPARTVYRVHTKRVG